MKINKITITGADNKVNPKDLLRLQADYPFVEWGILFSKSKEGHPRYPSLEWIGKLCELPLNLSAHFCGWYSKQVIALGDYSPLHFLNDRFERVQLNYNFDGSPRLLFKLNSYLITNPGKSVILQYNNTSKKIIDQMLNEFPGNIDFLFDESGGEGKNILTLYEPFRDHYTGYAGGLTEKNIEVVLERISQGAPSDSVWIDLETGARTNNDFDLKKVVSILKKSEKFIQIL